MVREQRHRRIGSCLIAAILLSATMTGGEAAAPKPTPSSASGGGAPVLPRPKRVVTDAAGWLSAADVTRLEAELVGLQKQGLAQIVIYIAPSLPAGANLEELTLRTANSWGVGRAGADDGLVIFVFAAERKVRIEVGLGLEKAISNEAAARVIRENIAPAFRRRAYGEGLHSAVQELARLIRSHSGRTSQ